MSTPDRSASLEPNTLMRCNARPRVFERKSTSSLQVIPNRSLPMRVAVIETSPSARSGASSARRFWPRVARARANAAHRMEYIMPVPLPRRYGLPSGILTSGSSYSRRLLAFYRNGLAPRSCGGLVAFIPGYSGGTVTAFDRIPRSETWHGHSGAKLSRCQWNSGFAESRRDEVGLEGF